MSESEELGDAVTAFVRAFGLHRPETTPCGFEASLAEGHALRALADGPLRQLELVDLLGLAKSTVSRLVSTLVQRGWAERSGAEGDRRGVTVTLTATGSDAAERLRRARANRMRALLDSIPQERRSDVIDVLHIMQEAARASDPHHS